MHAWRARAAASESARTARGSAVQRRSPLWSKASTCQGLRAGHALELPQLSLGAALGACRSSHENDVLRARSDELSADLSLAHVWDFTRLSISLGASAGPSWLRQRFDTPGRAPRRDSLALNLGALLGGAIALTHGYYTFAEAQGQVLRAAPRPRRR